MLVAFCCLTVFAVGCQMPTKGKPAASYLQLQYPKISDIKMPDIKEITLANGMKLLLLENHEAAAD